MLFFLSLYTARPSFEYYRQLYFVHSGVMSLSYDGHKKQAHPKRFYGEAGNQSYHHLERTKDYQTACQIKLQLFIEHQAIRLGPNYSTTSYMRGSRGGDQKLGPHPLWKITTL